MTVQTTYSTEHAAAYAGMLADNSIKDIVSKRVDLADGIGFGLGVVRSSVDNGDSGIVLPTAEFTADDFIGFTVRTLDEVSQQDGTFEKAQYSSASVAAVGRMWVPCPGGCSAGDQVYVIHAATNRGAASTTDDATTSPVARARFENTVPAGPDALALISINLSR